MSPWVGEAGPFLVAAALLVVPGLLLAYAAGLRGVVAWGLAPALSTTAVALAGVAGPVLGVRFGLTLVAGVTLVLGGVSAGVSRLVRRREPAPAEPRPTMLAALAGWLLGAVPVVVAIARGMGTPDVWPQTYDAVFHLNAVRRLLWTGDGSSRDLGATAQPDNTHVFYPAAWHDLVALVVQLTGAPLVPSVTAVSLGVAAVAWPLGCIVLVRQILGPRPGPVLAAGLLSGGFAAAPYLLLSYGTLWPNALATALLPPVVGLLAVSLRLTRAGGLDSGRAVLVGLLAAPGCILAHPNAAVTAVVVASVMVAFPLVSWARPAGEWVARRAAGAGGLMLLVLVVDVALLESPLFAGTRRTDWPAHGTVPQALGEYLFGAPVGEPLPLVMTGLLLLGAWRALHVPALRWLVACHAAGGVLYVAARATDARWAEALTSPWYNDAFRLAALGPVTGIPLAVIGLSWLVGSVQARARLRRRLIWVAAMAAVVLATHGLSIADHARVIATWYRSTELLGPEEAALVERLPALVPPGTSVAGNPWNGSALVQALAGRPATFPHLSGVWSADRRLVASSLSEAAGDPVVCSAARRLHIGYVLDGPVTFWPDDPRARLYAGLAVGGHPGFRPVATGGRLTLYRLSAC